jgi:uncharacterized protein YoxC
MNTTLGIVFLSLVVVNILLCIFFVFLHIRLENFAKRLALIYSNLDTLKQNQEDIVSETLRIYEEKNKEKSNRETA